MHHVATHSGRKARTFQSWQALVTMRVARPCESRSSSSECYIIEHDLHEPRSCRSHWDFPRKASMSNKPAPTPHEHATDPARRLNVRVTLGRVHALTLCTFSDVTPRRGAACVCMVTVNDRVDRSNLRTIPAYLKPPPRNKQLWMHII